MRISIGCRITNLANLHPGAVAITFAPQAQPPRDITWAELDRTSNRMARLLEERGVGQGAIVAVGLPNSLEHYFASIGAWKLGACVLPLNSRMPVSELERVVAVASPRVVIGDWDDSVVTLLRSAELVRHDSLSDDPLPDIVPDPGKAIASGGSTGQPKIIVDGQAWAFEPGDAMPAGGALGLRPAQVQLVAGALYHNTPFSWSHLGLFEDHRLILMDRFDAARAVDLVERYRVNFAFLAPTMMRRIARLEGIDDRDLTSLEAIFHTAAPCPPWLKRIWIDLVGPERVTEGFGSTEGVGLIWNRGDQWLDHPGTLGRPWNDTELRIIHEDGRDASPGEIGEVYMRLKDPSNQRFYYLGSPPARTVGDRWVSVGDLGWLDHDGWLFLADRRVDMIVTGGANVYPAEVEAVLTEHPDVADAAVVGVPDEEWGKRVHAIIQPTDWASPPAIDVLDALCRRHIASYKCPKSYEWVPSLPRDEAGKIRRSALAAERETDGRPFDWLAPARASDA